MGCTFSDRSLLFVLTPPNIALFPLCFNVPAWELSGLHKVDCAVRSKSID
jgi:hypothetical protein